MRPWPYWKAPLFIWVTPPSRSRRTKCAPSSNASCCIMGSIGVTLWGGFPPCAMRGAPLSSDAMRLSWRTVQPSDTRGRSRVGSWRTYRRIPAQFCGPGPQFDGARRRRPAAGSLRSPRLRSRTRDRTEAQQRQARARVLRAECSWTAAFLLESGSTSAALLASPCWSPETPFEICYFGPHSCSFTPLRARQLCR